MIIENLLKSGVFRHPVTDVQLLETHISYVVLTGDFAYKIKKTCKFSFVDYSTLELRHHFCLKELEFNRRLAADLYLDVVPIYEDDDGSLRVEDSSLCSRETSTPIEYAVKMRQFPQQSILSSRVDHHELTQDSVEQFGKDVALFHESVEPADENLECIKPHHIRQDAVDNIQVLQEGLPRDSKFQAHLVSLRQWTENEFELRSAAFAARIQNGFVRRCHGDMHLNNLIQFNGKVLAFDCIEFNEEFQWIDVFSDLAFPFMDFIAKGRSDLTWRLLNAYLQARNDWFGLEVLRFYAVYRSLVRAKVLWIGASKHMSPRIGHSSRSDAKPWEPYITTALNLAYPPLTRLAITHGLSGSGKSTRAIEYVDVQGGLRIRSDIERKRSSEPFRSLDMYSRASRDHIYDRLYELTRMLLSWRYTVVVDATFLKLAWRQRFRELALAQQVPFEILSCEAPLQELERRIADRKGDASDATIPVIRDQLMECEPLNEIERTHILGPPLPQGTGKSAGARGSVAKGGS